MKRFFTILCAVLVISAFTTRDVMAMDSRKETAIGAIAGLTYLGAACIAQLFLENEGMDLEWGARDLVFLTELGYFPKISTLEDGEKVTKKGTGIFWGGCYAWDYPVKWLGFIQPGFEYIVEMNFMIGEKDEDSVMDMPVFNFSWGMGPTLVLVEFPRFLRLKCGVGYELSLYRVNNLYVHPSLDIKISDFLTVNGAFFQTFYGTPISSNSEDASGRSVKRIIEAGFSIVFDAHDHPSNLAFRWMRNYESQTGDGEDGWKWDSYVIAYSLPSW